jgi:hypothetical protein
VITGDFDVSIDLKRRADASNHLKTITLAENNKNG